MLNLDLIYIQNAFTHRKIYLCKFLWTCFNIQGHDIKKDEALLDNYTFIHNLKNNLITQK